GLLAPKPLGVFRYRLLRSVPDNRLHFYLELAKKKNVYLHIACERKPHGADYLSAGRLPSGILY
ncbi:MAG: hypothetical protein KIC78_11045, partial [Prevotella sp.]|uniref:hypothetical protein n=1 Tax=Prevotella sp. TaxID=59823 RepID=UPI00257E9F67